MAPGTFTASSTGFPPSLFHSDRSISYGHRIPRQRQAHMFLLRACFTSDVQDVSWGPGQHNLVKFGLTTADISHFYNFSFQESIVYLRTELGSGALQECSWNKEPASPRLLGCWCQGSIGWAHSLMCTFFCSLTCIPTYFYKCSPHIYAHPCAYPMCLYISHTYISYSSSLAHTRLKIYHMHTHENPQVSMYMCTHTYSLHADRPVGPHSHKEGLDD